jgi:hypothetical protein
MMEVLIDTAKLNDAMYHKHGIDEEEFMNAVIFYNLMNDPEV